MLRFIQTTHQVSLFHRWEKGERKKRILCLSLSKSDEITKSDQIPRPSDSWPCARSQICAVTEPGQEGREPAACPFSDLWTGLHSPLLTGKAPAQFQALPGQTSMKKIMQKANSNPGVMDRGALLNGKPQQKCLSPRSGPTRVDCQHLWWPMGETLWISAQS